MAQLALDNNTHDQPSKPSNPTQEAVRVQVSLETLLYVMIIAVALVLRVTALDVVPLGDTEAHEALAALHRIDPTVPSDGEVIFPDNALGGLFNMLSMTIFGHGDIAARMPTALAGVLLVLTPLLYRRYLGRTGTLLLAVGLTISPVALMASRTMSGMIWALILVMVGGWLTLRFYESRVQAYALAATICLAGVLFLTTPYGILIGFALFCGLAWAVIGAERDDPAGRTVQELASVWSGFEAFIAALIAVAVVSTAFFTSPSGLSSVTQLPEVFFNGLTTRPAGTPIAYILLVALRYDLPFMIFGVLGVWMSWRENTFLERFLTGWFVWGIFCAVLYAGASSELALLLTFPAVGLTVSFVLRLLQTMSYGFWQVPRWLLPLNTLVVLAMLVSFSTGIQALGNALQEEAQISNFAKVLDTDGTSNIRIGTLKPEASGSSMVVNLPSMRLVNCQQSVPAEELPELVQSADGRWCEQEPITRDYTILVNAIDAGAKDSLFTMRDPDGETVYEPTRLGEELRFSFHAEKAGDYRLELTKVDGQVLEDYAQYLVLVERGNYHKNTGTKWFTGGAFLLDIPNFYASVKIMARALLGWSFVLVLSLMLFIPLTFFLVGAIYGSRASSRGLAFGVLGFLSLYGMANGWQATTHYGGDVRELWYSDAVPEDYHSLQDTLVEYSQRENGTVDLIPIIVQGESDGALGWALRNFPNAKFVPQIPVDTATAAVISLDQPRPTMAVDYVGQELILDYKWNLSSLNWTDILSWLTTRRTRFEPQVENPYRLWIRADVYDVVNVPKQ